jgi:hypothetical protein
MSEHVTIDRRFNGPPESGHGGYVCGVVAGLIGDTAEVTLRRPPPLDRPLEVQHLDGGGVALSDGETVIVDGAPASVEIEVPEPVNFPEAEAASRSYVGFHQHAFPTCFGCGPQHSEGDGLRIFPGQVEGRNIVAAPWTPDATLTDEGGTVRPEFVWAALDCTGGWALLAQLPERPVVLGRMAAKLLAPVRAGERYVVIGWPLGEDGRKLYSGTALFSEGGELRAFAAATWVRLA